MAFERITTPESKHDLESLFRAMPEEERLILESEIFNFSEMVPLEIAFEVITEPEDTAALDALFSEYLALRSQLSERDRAAYRAKVNEFVDERLG